MAPLVRFPFLSRFRGCYSVSAAFSNAATTNEGGGFLKITNELEGDASVKPDEVETSSVPEASPGKLVAPALKVGALSRRQQLF